MTTELPEGHQIAENFGLLPGLRAHKIPGSWRCNHCRGYQLGESTWIVWVPTSVLTIDASAAVSEQCRKNALNGHLDGWCLKCAKALGRINVSRFPINEGVWLLPWYARLWRWVLRR